MKGFLWLFVGLTSGLGCTHAVHVNHTSDFVLTKPLADHRRIESHAEQLVVLGFVGQTDFADNAYRRLMSQCEGGIVTGIQTRYSTSHGFFSWMNEVKMWGYCSQ